MLLQQSAFQRALIKNANNAGLTSAAIHRGRKVKGRREEERLVPSFNAECVRQRETETRKSIGEKMENQRLKGEKEMKGGK